MAEHVHEWIPDILGARCDCGRALSKDNLIERLNKCETSKKATDALSAESARVAVNFICADEYYDTYTDEIKDLRAYADILEEK